MENFVMGQPLRVRKLTPTTDSKVTPYENAELRGFHPESGNLYFSVGSPVERGRKGKFFHITYWFIRFDPVANNYLVGRAIPGGVLPETHINFDEPEIEFKNYIQDYTANTNPMK